MKRLFSIATVALAASIFSCSLTALPPPPAYDHVVVVMEENRSASDVAGSPYLTELAGRGVSFTRMYGLVHPSQPNYIALFSGSMHGVTDDGVYDIDAPNLLSSLSASHRTFASYSEGLPSVGYRGAIAGRYVRKHNAVASFTNTPSVVNLPFSSFPTDHYAELPTVSFVAPDLDNDMHDGSVATADAWLRTNLDGYARWAVANNSALIVTFDESTGMTDPRTTPIATIVVGAGLRQGENSTPLTLYSLLRMLEEMYGLPTLGEEGTAARITGIWE
jgi:acid phosphatase